MEFVDISAVLRCGVYALVYRGTVVYVGKSKVMVTRISTHRSAWGRKNVRPPGRQPIRGILFDGVWVMPVAEDRLDEVEREMINRYKPRYNTRLVSATPPDLAEILRTLIPMLPPDRDPEPRIRRRI